VLVGFGLWWGDAVAAGLISLAIVYDGWINVRQVVADLMDETPTELGTHDEHETLPRKIKAAAEELDWVERAAVRLREHGRALTGDVFVVPRTEDNLVRHIEDASARLQKLDWRLHDLTVTPVSRIDEDAPPRVGGRGA